MYSLAAGVQMVAENVPELPDQLSVECHNCPATNNPLAPPARIVPSNAEMTDLGLILVKFVSKRQTSFNFGHFFCTL